MLYRKITDYLEKWKNSQNKKALCIKGARQIGKTTAVREFAKANYEVFIELNFAMQEDARKIFTGSLTAKDLLPRISAYSDKPLIEGKTLILLDEIQECPNARTAIKSLVEYGKYDYIETGSLLGVGIKQVQSLPVGFEETIRMYPMDFEEFALAAGTSRQTLELLEDAFEKEIPIDDVIHEKLLTTFYAYLVVGGMPDAVQTFVDTRDIASVKRIQQGILDLYRSDITKYSKSDEGKNIRLIFDSIPSELDSKNRRFKISNVTPESHLSRLENCFIWLSDAGVALPCFNALVPETPLKLNTKYSLFKLFMSDPGLLAASALDNIQFDLLMGNTDINMGAILENAIASQISSQDHELYYYNSKKYGEVDFLVQNGSKVLPIEVKSGNAYTAHKALSNILAVEKWNIDKAYVISKHNLKKEGDVVYIPYYMCLMPYRKKKSEPMIFDVDLRI